MSNNNWTLWLIFGHQGCFAGHLLDIIHGNQASFVQNHQNLSENVRHHATSKLMYFFDASACTACSWACFLTCSHNMDTTDLPILCKCHMWCISLHPACTMNLSFFPLLLCICGIFRCRSLYDVMW